MTGLQLIAAAGGGGTVLLALATRTRPVQRVDDAVETYVITHRERMHRIASVLTLTGEKFIHPVIGAVTALVLTLLHPGDALRFIIPLASASLGGIVSHHLVKFAYHRPRPAGALARNKTEGAYPSGHTTNATAVVATSAFLLVHEGVSSLAVAIALVLALALATGASRVALGWHWATDVLGGWMAGSAVAALACLAYLRLGG